MKHALHVALCAGLFFTPSLSPAAPIQFFEIYVTKLDVSKAYYGKLFGWTFTKTSDKDFELITTGDKDAVSGGVAVRPAFPRGQAGVVLFVTVSDISEALAANAVLGGTRVTGVIDIGVGYIAHIKDPDGNELALYQLKVRAP